MKTKFKIFFRRVSSKGQDLAMQISADAPYREGYLSNEILVIDEFDVSANKLKLSERPKMLKLFSMIINNQVDIIYAFDRTRLFRDFYEGNQFVSLCRMKNVKVFFTSTNNGHLQSTDSTLVEGVLNIVSDMEGKNIARRTEEARKRYPSKKLGYIKIKESKQYKHDELKSLILKEFFSDFLKVSTFDELDNLLTNYKKKLQTSSETLIKILSDPFYAGFDLSTGKNKLTHVEPYLTLSQFEELQEKNSLLKSYKEKILNLREQNIYQPICGICRKPMLFRVNTVEQNAFYSCSRKHLKLTISINDLSEIIKLTLDTIIKQFDIDKLMSESNSYFKSMKKTLNYQLETLQRDKDKLLDEILLKEADYSRWKEDPKYKELVTFEQKIKNENLNLTTTEELLLKNQTIVKLIQEYLYSINKSNHIFLYSMLIERLIIFENEFDLRVKYFGYIKDIKETFTYEEGVLL